MVDRSVVSEPIEPGLYILHLRHAGTSELHENFLEDVLRRLLVREDRARVTEEAVGVFVIKSLEPFGWHTGTMTPGGAGFVYEIFGIPDRSIQRAWSYQTFCRTCGIVLA